MNYQKYKISIVNKENPFKYHLKAIKANIFNKLIKFVAKIKIISKKY